MIEYVLIGLLTSEVRISLENCMQRNNNNRNFDDNISYLEADIIPNDSLVSTITEMLEGDAYGIFLLDAPVGSEKQL